MTVKRQVIVRGHGRIGNVVEAFTVQEIAALTTIILKHCTITALRICSEVFMFIQVINITIWGEGMGMLLYD